MEAVLSQLFNGLSLSSILLLVALGLSITFGIMGVINFAHGEFMMIGATSPTSCSDLSSKAMRASRSSLRCLPPSLQRA